MSETAVLHDFAAAVARETAAGARLAMLFAEPAGDALTIVALLARGGGVTRLEATTDAGSYPAITPLVPAAHWYEREIHDLHGLDPDGHPRLEPLLTHAPEREVDSDWEVPEHRGGDRLTGPGVFLIPYGPVRSGIFESAQFLVQTNGEDIAYCAQRLFFKRRGAERRICEVPLDLAVLVAERVSGTSSVAHALAFCQALETLASTDVPPRAASVRSLLAELERLYNHVETIARECEDAALSVGQATFAALKERLHRLAWSLTGNRFLRGAVVPGGVTVDVDAAARDRVLAELDGWAHDFRSARQLLLRTDSFLDRLITAGPLSHADARDFACVGPVARGSGIATDARADRPYAAYADLEPAVEHDGDAMARLNVRLAEIETSLGMIGRLVRELPAGGIRRSTAPLSVEQALGWAESARGETLYYLRAADSDRLAFCKLRAASFVNFGVFNRIFASQVLTDFGFVEHSFGLSPAGCDA